MIITAWYLTKKVLLGVPEGSLVYDGRGWVTPASAKSVVLTTKASAQVVVNRPVTYQTAYKEPSCEEPPPPKISLAFNNLFICKVLSVSEGSLPEDILAVPAPEGFCLCGVTCVGTEIKDVNVYVKN